MIMISSIKFRNRSIHTERSCQSSLGFSVGVSLAVIAAFAIVISRWSLICHLATVTASNRSNDTLPFLQRIVQQRDSLSRQLNCLQVGKRNNKVTQIKLNTHMQNGIAHTVAQKASHYQGTNLSIKSY